MKLRTTAIIVIFSTFLCLFVLLYAAFWGNIQIGFNQLERQAVLGDLERVHNALSRDLQILSGMAADWGLWDDTYQYLKAPSEAYVRANVTPQALGELHLNLFALFDTEGRVVLAKFYDSTAGVLRDVRPAMAAMLPHLADVLPRDGRRGGHSGVIEFNGRPCMVASRLVLTSTLQGPSVGYLLMGQVLDARRIRMISELTRVDVRLLGLTSPELPSGLAAALAVGDKQPFPAVVPLGKSRVAGYDLLRDLRGEPIGLWAIRLPRTIRHQGDLLIRSQVVSLLTSGIVFGLALLYFVEKGILSRIAQLVADIRALGQGTRTRVRPLSGNNELTGLARDINTMLDDLDTARTNYALATRAAKVGVWSVNLDAGTLTMDPVITGLLGYQDADGPEPLSVWRERLQAQDRRRLERLPSETAWHHGEDLDSELRFVAHDGSLRWFLARGRVVASASGVPQQLMGTVVDITALKRAAESIRALSGQLMRAQEAERSRLARDLHDNVAQDLSSLKIACETLFDDMPEVRDTLRTRLDAATRILSRTIGSVRELAYALRPPDLDHLGLAQALRRLCEEFSRTSGMAADFSGVGLDGLDLDPDVAINLYRIAQEALSNARKHSGGREVSVRLVESYPRLILRVRDDGQGFDPAQQDRETGYTGMGLVNMRERVALFGGSLRIVGGPGLGTTVVAEIPYIEASEHAAQEEPADC